MMRFRQAKENITATLGDAADGRFTVIGYQRQVPGRPEKPDAEQRLVQVFYQRSQFPQSASPMRGPIQHRATYALELSVYTAARGNVTELLEAAETDEDRKAALETFKEAADLADEALDELFDVVFQILMDARNFSFGFTDKPRVVGDRWITELSKDDPVPHGAHVLLTGRSTLELSIVEDIEGAETVAGDLIALDILTQEEENARAGVKVAAE